MPIVNGKHYPYSPKGMTMAKRAKKRKTSGESYSRNNVKMAREMMKK